MSTFTNTAREVEMPNGDVVVIHNAPTGGENTTSNIKKFKYDDNGHVTESTAANATDLNLNSYSTPSSGSTDIGASDPVQTAIGKLDHQSKVDQSNISYALGKTGKNVFDFDAWIDGLTVTNGSFTKSGNAIAITATGNDAYTNRFNGNKADAYKIAAKSGETIVIQWDADLAQASHGGLVYVFPNGNNAGMSYASASAEKIVFAVPSGCDFVTVRFGVANSGETIAYSNIMICMQEDWDVSPDYQPYSGLSNLALTELENKNAIYNLSTGVKNLFNFDVWKDVEIERGTKTVGANNITIAATSADAYTKYGLSYPETVKIYVQTGDVIVLSWDYTPNNSQTDDKTYIFGFASNPTTPVSNSNTYSQTEYLEYTVPATVQYVEIRFGVTTNGYSATYSNIMVCTKAVWDQEPNVYRPFALPNSELTKLESEDRAALVEQVDNGAKNLFDLQSVTSSQYGTNNATLAFNSDQTNFTVTATSKFGYARILATSLTPNAKYTLSFTVSNRNVDVSGTAILVRNAALSTTLATKEITANGRVDIEFVVPNNDTSVYMAFYASMESASTTNTYTVSDVMVCTKVAFDVSQKYVPYRPSYDVVVADVAKAQYTVQTANFACSAANTYEYTGLSVTVPAGHIYEIMAYDSFSNNAPIGIAIALTNNNAEITTTTTIVAEDSGKTSADTFFVCRSVTCITNIASSNRTYYLFVKHNNNTGSNPIALMWRQIV